MSSSLHASDCSSAIMFAKHAEIKFLTLADYPKLYASLTDNLAFSTRLLDGKSEARLGEALGLLNELQKYLGKREFEGAENILAQLFYHKGIIYYDMKDYFEATASLEEAVKYIDKYDEDDKALGEELLALVLNQRAACYMMSAKQWEDRQNSEKANYCFNRCITDIKKSLDLRLRIHGEYSFYTATAYENFAKYLQKYEVSQPGFSKLSSEVYRNIEKALKIKKIVFSEYGKSTARSYMIMAWCLDADGNYNEMFFDCLERAERINSAEYGKDVEMLRNRAQNYLVCNG